MSRKNGGWLQVGHPAGSVSSFVKSEVFIRHSKGGILMLSGALERELQLSCSIRSHHVQRKLWSYGHACSCLSLGGNSEAGRVGK